MDNETTEQQAQSDSSSSLSPCQHKRGKTKWGLGIPSGFPGRGGWHSLPRALAGPASPGKFETAGGKLGKARQR